MPSYVHHSSQLTPEIPAREIAVLSLEITIHWRRFPHNLFVDHHPEPLSLPLSPLGTTIYFDK
jgi:hypothetical protein